MQPDPVRRRLLPLATAVACAACLPVEAVASPLSGSISLGAEYDSNVSLDEGDINSHLGDAAVTLGANVDLRVIDTKPLRLRLGYGFDLTTHQDLEDFDLEIHQLTASASLRAGKASLGMDYRYAHVRLDRDGFLDLHFVSPSISGFVSKNGFARLGATYTRKAYRTSTKLDANTLQLTADFYRFFSKRKGYVALGIRHDAENAGGPEFDYRANQASVRAQIPFRAIKTAIRLQLSYAYGERDYRNVTPSIGERRREKRSTYGISLDAALTKRLSFRPALRFVDRQSNVPAFDYREHTVTTELRYKF